MGSLHYTAWYIKETRNNWLDLFLWHDSIFSWQLTTSILAHGDQLENSNLVLKGCVIDPCWLQFLPKQQNTFFFYK